MFSVNVKDLQLGSRKTDRERLFSLAWAGFFVVAAGFGCCLAAGLSDEIRWWRAFRFFRFDLLRVSFINAGISLGLAAFTWSVFRLFRPIHPNRNWRIAEVVVVPFCWLLLLLAVDVLLGWLVQQSFQDFQDIVPQPTLRH
jgi:uncharacterized BrkB/YihY/UPF0761 family membrane protein